MSYQDKTDTELSKIINSVSPGSMNWYGATNEQHRRQLERISKPHWLVWLSVGLTIIAVLFAGISAWPIAKSWFQVEQSVGILKTDQTSPQLKTKQ